VFVGIWYWCLIAVLIKGCALFIVELEIFLMKTILWCLLYNCINLLQSRCQSRQTITEAFHVSQPKIIDSKKGSQQCCKIIAYAFIKYFEVHSRRTIRDYAYYYYLYYHVWTLWCSNAPLLLFWVCIYCMLIIHVFFI